MHKIREVISLPLFILLLGALYGRGEVDATDNVIDSLYRNGIYTVNGYKGGYGLLIVLEANTNNTWCVQFYCVNGAIYYRRAANYGYSGDWSAWKSISMT